MSYRTRKSPAASIAPIAGERVHTRLLNRMWNIGILFVLRATVDVSVAAATSVRNRGSVAALFDGIGIAEGGIPTWEMDGPSARFISEMFAPNELDTGTRAAVDVGTYELEEAIYLPLANLLQGDPMETAYLEDNPGDEFTAWVKQKAAADLAAALYVVGPATVAVSGVSVDVVQVHRTRSGRLPLFKPRARQIVRTINGSNGAEVIDLKTTHHLRGIAVKQETSTVGEVDDIITSLALLGDEGEFIGPKQIPWDNAQLLSEMEFGGQVYTSDDAARSYLAENFCRAGQLAEALEPGQVSNLRIEADVDASASAGTSRVRVTLLELDRVGELPGGRRVTAPMLPWQSARA